MRRERKGEIRREREEEKGLSMGRDAVMVLKRNEETEGKGKEIIRNEGRGKERRKREKGDFYGR